MAPPRKENQPTVELRMPIALSIPCTGNGVKTSQRVQPASRTFCAACRTSAAVVNSAIIPYGLEVPFIASTFMVQPSSAFRPAQRMVRVGLRRDALDLRGGDQRQESDEQQEAGKEQAERANVGAYVHPGRLVVTPVARYEILVE